FYIIFKLVIIPVQVILCYICQYSYIWSESYYIIQLKRTHFYYIDLFRVCSHLPGKRKPYITHSRTISPGCFKNMGGQGGSSCFSITSRNRHNLTCSFVPKGKFNLTD